MLQSMESQRVRHDLVTEQQQHRNSKRKQRRKLKCHNKTHMNIAMKYKQTQI